MSNAEPTAQIFAIVGSLVSLLASREFNAIECLTKGTRLTADDIREALAPLQSVASDSLNLSGLELDIVEVRGSLPRRWSVNVPLYEGSGTRSDLTMYLTLIESDIAGEAMTVELDDIHVL